MEPEVEVECVASRDGTLEYPLAVEPHGVTLVEVSSAPKRLVPDLDSAPARA
jgi:hypothetical protein